MNYSIETEPDSTAARVSLWRAMHVQIDSPPHILEDEIGYKLLAPDESWRNRPDMHPQGTSRFRASILARSRFIEDLVIEQIGLGLDQYVILGAGLDSFAQRKSEVMSRLHLYEVDQPGTQAWKKRRLTELGFELLKNLQFVPFNFELNSSLWHSLSAAGFDKTKATVVSSLGVSMYLTRDAIQKILCEMAGLAAGSKFVMTFMLPIEMTAPEDQFGYQMSIKGALASGTPFISFFAPEEMIDLARQAGFKKVEHLSTASLAPKYFSKRTDNLKPSTGEELLIASL